CARSPSRCRARLQSADRRFGLTGKGRVRPIGELQFPSAMFPAFYLPYTQREHKSLSLSTADCPHLSRTQKAAVEMIPAAASQWLDLSLCHSQRFKRRL